MPSFSTKSAAGIAMLKEVREHLIDSPKMRDPEKLLEIARPITASVPFKRIRFSLVDQEFPFNESDIILGINGTSYASCLYLSSL